ncbi:MULTISPECIES: hypothetical protein [Lactobacillus]|nr:MULTISPECIES: hypothetical protein [Lactobacillus]
MIREVVEGEAMEVIDKRKESKDEDWNVGDVVNNNIHLAIIAKNNDGRYCLMDIDPQHHESTYSTEEQYIWGNSCRTLEKLKISFPSWHKVNAKLVIE